MQYVYVVVMAVLIGLIGVVAVQWVILRDIRTDLQACTAKATTMERINDAISDNPDADTILERLRTFAE